MNYSPSDVARSVGVIDTHCHIASPDFLPLSFVDGILSNMVLALASQGIRAAPSRIRDLYLAKLQDPLCDELVAEMDAAGVAQGVLLAPDFTYALKDNRLSIEEILLHHRKVTERHPGKFFVFAGVDPRWGQVGLDLFERSIRDFGFHGLKVYHPAVSTPAIHVFTPTTRSALAGASQCWCTSGGPARCSRSTRLRPFCSIKRRATSRK